MTVDVGDISPCNAVLLSCLDTAMMNGSNIGNPSSNNKSKDEQVVNGHDENENNPFAEYMWMENEEDFNRQVCAGGEAGPEGNAGPVPEGRGDRCRQLLPDLFIKAGISYLVMFIAVMKIG